MYETVYYIVKSNLHYYPPCMSQIKMLKDQGTKVIVVYGSSEPVAIQELTGLGIKSVQLTDPRGKFKGKLDKINNWLSFRKSLKAYLRKIDRKKSLLWFGNAETMLPMKGLIENKYHYMITFLELLDHKPKRLKMLCPMAQRAEAVITCEETRSYIMQYWFKLQKLPYTMPNKPYSIPYTRNSSVSTEKGQYVMNALDGHKYIIYQGIFQYGKYLETIAAVLRDHYPDLFLVMMGTDSFYGVVDQVKKIYQNTIHIEYIPAPLHLEVTSNAYIGLLFYEPDTLNKAFCAPNKIFEYSIFGIPSLGNDIPGLSNTVGKSGAGVCVDFTYDNVKNAIADIIEHYDQYSENAVKFFNSVDNTQVLAKIIEDVQINTR